MSADVPDQPASRPVWGRIVKWTLLAIVLVAVGWQAWKLGSKLDLTDVTLRPVWLIPAVLAYVAGWMPAVWFWKVMLKSVGDDVPWRHVIRAYYCGQLGKYIPGKAGVLVIRAGLVNKHGARTSTAAVTAAFETLTTMAVGAALAAALGPWIIPPETQQVWFAGWPYPDAIPLLLPLVVIVGCGLGLPVLTAVLNLLLRKLLPALEAGASTPQLKPTLVSLIPLVLAWWLHGLSLGCTIQAVSSDPLSLAHWPVWTACVTWATVLGFAALFAPGGLGVREGVIMGILGPQIGPRGLLVAGLLRLVWLVGEIASAAVLYYGIPSDHQPGELSSSATTSQSAP